MKPNQPIVGLSGLQLIDSVTIYQPFTGAFVASITSLYATIHS
jgi:hypothetical protein